jgi:hypothetical protein
VIALDAEQAARLAEFLAAAGPPLRPATTGVLGRVRRAVRPGSESEKLRPQPDPSSRSPILPPPAPHTACRGVSLPRQRSITGL